MSGLSLREIMHDAMLSYATVGSNRLDEAKAFYDELLAYAGITRLFEHPSGGRVYGKDGRVVFGVLAPFDGAPATVGNGTMVAFHFETPDEVIAFHRKALELGAKDEGAPGFRGGSPFFMSYFRDLDGNKLCAYHQAWAIDSDGGLAQRLTPPAARCNSDS